MSQPEQMSTSPDPITGSQTPTTIVPKPKQLPRSAASSRSSHRTPIQHPQPVKGLTPATCRLIESDALPQFASRVSVPPVATQSEPVAGPSVAPEDVMETVESPVKEPTEEEEDYQEALDLDEFEEALKALIRKGNFIKKQMKEWEAKLDENKKTQELWAQSITENIDRYKNE